MNVIYLISCTNCNEDYVGSAIDLKKNFQNTKKWYQQQEQQMWSCSSFHQ